MRILALVALLMLSFIVYATCLLYVYRFVEQRETRTIWTIFITFILWAFDLKLALSFVDYMKGVKKDKEEIDNFLNEE